MSRRLSAKGRRAASTGKPHRPLTAYNLFFRDERVRVVGASDDKTPDSPGKIGFKEMARIIAHRWKALDKKTHMEYERSAVDERKKYFTALQEWERVKTQEKLAKRAAHFSRVRRTVRHSERFPPLQREAFTHPTSAGIPVLPQLERDSEPIDDEELKDFLSTLDFSQL